MLAAPLISMVFHAAAYAKPPAPAGRAATCAAIEKETQKLITDALKAGEFELSAKDFIEGIKPLGTCIEPVVGGGQWALVLTEAPSFMEEDVTENSFDENGDLSEDGPRSYVSHTEIRNWTPVFVTADGKRVALDDVAALPSFSAYLGPTGRLVPSSLPDSAGKGGVEAFVRPLPDGQVSAVFQHEGILAVILRYDGKAVTVHPVPDVMGSPTSVRDLDQDNILDLIDAYSLSAPYPDGVRFRAFDLIAKGLPDGTFDTHAPFVLDTYRKHCSKMGRSPWVLSQLGPEVAAKNIFCGVLFGVPKATIRAGLLRESEATQDPKYSEFVDLFILQDSLLRTIDRDWPLYVNRTDGFRALELNNASAISAVKSFGVYDFGAAQAVDGDRGTSWQPLKAKDAWLELKLRGPEPVAALEFANGFQRSDELGDLFAMNSRPTKVTVALGGKTFDLTLDPASRELQRLDLPEVVTTDTIRITVKTWKKGSRWDHVAISEVVPLAR
jgi:hypothetical protein